MDQQDVAPWALFLGGKWQKKRPTRPGYYPVASREGDPLAPERYLTIDDKGRHTGVPYGEPGWQGWWWSSPLPPMPKMAERREA